MQYDACELDYNIRCVNDTGCRECIRSENEWAVKWIQYLREKTLAPIDPEIHVENTSV